MKTALFLFGILLAVAGCSSKVVHEDQYAKLSNHRTYERDLSTIWTSVEKAIGDAPIHKRSVDSPKEHSLETEWVVEDAGDKYQDYTINGAVKRVQLRSRYKYKIVAKPVMGGTDVVVETHEEVEKLNPATGLPSGWNSAEQVDTSRAAILLDKIYTASLSF